MALQTSADIPQGTIATFYDNLMMLMLREFINQNPRVEEAIRFVASRVTREMRSFLDVGCGIGATTSAICALCPHLVGHGLDISPRCIEAASKLFGRNGLRFFTGNMEAPPEGSPYDIVALIDAYEHIPRAKWPQLNAVLGDCLSPEGVLVLTAPTPLTQDWFARNDPQGLQVVDETIELSDILQLAKDLGGHVTFYQMASIHKSNDYLHVVIERSPKLCKPASPTGRLNHLRGLLARRRRSAEGRRRRGFVRTRLGLTVPA